MNWNVENLQVCMKLENCKTQCKAGNPMYSLVAWWSAIIWLRLTLVSMKDLNCSYQDNDDEGSRSLLFPFLLFLKIPPSLVCETWYLIMWFWLLILIALIFLKDAAGQHTAVNILLGAPWTHGYGASLGIRPSRTLYWWCKWPGHYALRN